MNDHNQHLLDGAPIEFVDKGQRWTATWHDLAGGPPDGGRHGSAAICFTPDHLVVVVSEDGLRWELPGGRPEVGESWRETVDREVLEEACAKIVDGTLLGYVRGSCTFGPEEGLVLVRSLWGIEVSLLPWEPEHEMNYREFLKPENVLSRIDFPEGLRPVYEMWLGRALDLQHS